MLKNYPPDVQLTCQDREHGPDILALTVVSELGRIPFLRARLNLSDGDQGESFKPGAAIELKAGYDGELGLLFSGVLTGLSFSLRGGRREVELEARDWAHSLGLGLNTALFLDKSDSQVCAAILSEHGLGADIPPTSPVHKQLQQLSCTDWDFILARLWANALIPLVKNGRVQGLKLEKLGAGKQLVIDAAKDALLELELRRESRSWLSNVTAKTWNEAKQSVQEKRLDEASPVLPDLAYGPALGSGEQPQEILVPHQLADEEMRNLAQGLLWQARQGSIQGRLRLPGLAAAEPGDGLELKGFFGPAEGKTAIWASRLEIRPGECRHELQFGYDFLEKTQADQVGSGLSGPWRGDVSQAQGLYPGKVLKISGDPEQGERIQVHIPLLHEAGTGVWARAATLYAGEGRAVLFRPEQDDEVILGFLGGDPGAPVILGALPSKAHPAPQQLAAKDEKNSRKGWVSKSGLSLLLNEEDKSLTLQTPAGQSLCLDDKQGTVSLKDENDNSLLLDKNGIHLKSGKDIKLEARGNIELKAAKNLKLEALQAGLEAKQSVKLAGQVSAELQAGGPLTIKGAIVKIN